MTHLLLAAMADMTSSRPYLLRAVHEWIVDNSLTPHLIVNADAEGVEVPPRYVENGKIILNVAPGATKDLKLGNNLIRFRARFGGRPFDVSLPPSAVLAVYARENGLGMAFENEGTEGEPPPEPSGRGKSRPALRIVK